VLVADGFDGARGEGLGRLGLRRGQGGEVQVERLVDLVDLVLRDGRADHGGHRAVLPGVGQPGDHLGLGVAGGGGLDVLRRGARTQQGVHILIGEVAVLVALADDVLEVLGVGVGGDGEGPADPVLVLRRALGEHARDVVAVDLGGGVPAVLLGHGGSSRIGSPSV